MGPPEQVRIEPFVLYADASDADVSDRAVTVWVSEHGIVPPAGRYEGTMQTRHGEAHVEITVPRPEPVDHVDHEERRILDLRLRDDVDVASVGRTVRLQFHSVLLDAPLVAEG